MSKKFFIDKTNQNGGGPEIFGFRLREELVKQGHSFVLPFNSYRPDNNLSIIFGNRYDFCKNLSAPGTKNLVTGFVANNSVNLVG